MLHILKLKSGIYKTHHTRKKLPVIFSSRKILHAHAPEVGPNRRPEFKMDRRYFSMNDCAFAQLIAVAAAVVAGMLQWHRLCSVLCETCATVMPQRSAISK